jgi:predicted XRE-type DNA-binding protein
MRYIGEGSDETKLKVELAKRLNELIALRGMSQHQAAAQIGTSQSKVSQISRYRLTNVSVGRLLQALVSFEQRIDTNDLLYAFESSRDFDAEPGLSQVKNSVA